VKPEGVGNIFRLIAGTSTVSALAYGNITAELTIALTSQLLKLTNLKPSTESPQRPVRVLNLAGGEGDIDKLLPPCSGEGASKRGKTDIKTDIDLNLDLAHPSSKRARVEAEGAEP
jgi:hypothetical protein